ncbi:ABC transporter substrate-binding protein [Paramagnetospirillum magneticum]|uniref:Putative aliphatic sulfonates-binding protein n=1 Tax=Paramagnetospirillum magneticum (strain ATCC 700264 / AMB-1) TaxID=342108 RepID=Q2W661_PARM1|nr:ABC transporter substrate-binding protein [Paramagnetospirillum magneticum]BAE50664.1 ABC-type nitrate/sulfonate/bicarbonate transport systems [Paramagnetospirillum magneticum AMB-1]
MSLRTALLTGAAILALTAPAQAGQTLTIGIGTQDTTTNTVTAGAVIRELKLLDKYLPKTGKYADITVKLDWQNFTSGPPVTNGMMAGKLQFGAMGDYPLVVNGYTFQSNPDAKSQLISVAAYNINGSGNGLVVHKDSPYYELSDLKGKVVSVPFGSAAHGMLLKTMQDKGWGADYWKLVSQSPEVGATNLQEKKIDAHADFVPFAELLPFRGFARKIYDGVESGAATWHGVVVRTDFAEKYPEIVVAYLKAQIEAEQWIKADPKRAAEQIAKWTGIDKEVVYIFLGPGGIMTVDPTIKPALVADAADDARVLQKLDRIKDFDVAKWVNDSYIRKAYAELGLNYEGQLSSLTNYEVRGHDSFCKTAIAEPRKAGQIWIENGDIAAYSSPKCTLAAFNDLKRKGQKVKVAYLYDTTLGIKLFADQAFYAIPPKGGDATPFLVKKDAEAHAARIGGKVAGFDEALVAVGAGS